MDPEGLNAAERVACIEDDDMGDMFRARRAASQEKRASNRDSSTAMLVERGVYFTSHNLGAHLIVLDKWNFWPGTGKWKERKGVAGKAKREGRGVLRLLRVIEEDGNAA